MRRSIWERTALVLLSMVAFLVPGRAAATIIRVPGDEPTINAAVEGAAAGDTVLVAAGAYSDYETRSTSVGIISSVAFLKGGITLLSESGPEATTLHMEESVGGPHVVWADVEQGTINMVGFTITGSVQNLVGARFVFCERVVVEDCRFRDLGTGQSVEVGLECGGTSAEVRNCRFVNINANGFFGDDGDFVLEDCHFENCSSGAMQVTEGLDTQPTTLVLRNSTFFDNTRTLGAGGACFVGGDDVVIEGCWFEGNSAIGSSASGGGVRVAIALGTAVIHDNTFVNNFVTGNGVGGAVRVSATQMHIMGNTFQGNGQELTVYGGAAAATNGEATLLQNVVTGSPAGVAAIRRMGGTLATSCNVFWDNPGGEADNFALDPTDVIADPLYCDPEGGDFTISGNSPCLPQNSNGCGLIGAWGEGCGFISVERDSWARTKARYRGDRE